MQAQNSVFSSVKESTLHGADKGTPTDSQGSSIQQAVEAEVTAVGLEALQVRQVAEAAGAGQAGYSYYSYEAPSSDESDDALTDLEKRGFEEERRMGHDGPAFGRKWKS